MSSIHRAVENLSADILVVQNNKVICTAKGFVGNGDKWVAVTFVEDSSIVEKIKQTKFYETHKENLHWKYLPFRFMPITGTFLCCGFTGHEEIMEELEAIFEDVRIVNAFQLRWGMVPDTFKDVEGYRKGPDQHYTHSAEL